MKITTAFVGGIFMPKTKEVIVYMDDFLILLQAKLDEAKSKGNVKSDIDKLQSQLDKLKVQVELDPKSAQKLADDIGKLINQKITISNIGIDTNKTLKTAQQTGQQIGNAINQGVTNTVSKAGNTLKSFSDLRNFSELNKSINNFHVDTSELKNYKSILDEVKNTYAEFGQVRITNEIFKDGVLEKFKVNIEQVNGDLKETKSFIMALNDEKDAFVFSGLISGSESVVQHLDKTKDAVNQTAEAINALREKSKIDKIQLSMDTGETESKIDALIARTNQWTDVNGNARISTQSLTSALDDLGLASNEYIKTPTEENQRKLIDANEKLSIEYRKVASEVRSMNAELAKDTAVDALRQKYQKFYNDNGKAHKAFGNQLKSAMTELAHGAEIPKYRLEELKQELIEISNSCVKLGKTGQTWFQSLGDKIKQLSTYLSGTVIIGKVLQTGKQMIDNVSKIDDSLVELEKVSNLTAEGLENVTDKSFELGKSLSKTGTDVLDSVTSFKRAGYDIADSMEYAEEALKTTNISENLKDAGQAADSLVNIMKGFRNESPEFARKINDAVNQVSNTEAVDFDNLIDGATRLSAVADQAGMSFEQMLGTLTGGYEILGNMEKVATGQITIFSRLQAIQLDGEEEVSTVAKLQETFNNATKGAVNIVDQTTGQLRNVFDILDDIANVWDSLDKNTREALAIEASGIRQKNVFLAMMQNWDGVKDAVESASNSFGSADEENEKYIKSIQGRVENFERSVQQLSRTVLDSDLVKFFVDLGTTGVNAIDKIVDKLGSLGTIGTIGGAIAGAKGQG